MIHHYDFGSALIRGAKDVQRTKSCGGFPLSTCGLSVIAPEQDADVSCRCRPCTCVVCRMQEPFDFPVRCLMQAVLAPTCASGACQPHPVVGEGFVRAIRTYSYESSLYLRTRKPASCAYCPPPRTHRALLLGWAEGLQTTNVAMCLLPVKEMG